MEKTSNREQMFLLFLSDTIEYVIELTSLHSIEIGRYSLCAIQVQTFICRVFVELFFVHLSTKPVFDEYTYMALATYTLKQSSNEKLQSLAICMYNVYSHSFFFVAALTIHSSHTRSLSTTVSLLLRELDSNTNMSV